jgi:fused signal recognition particle receptor
MAAPDVGLLVEIWVAICLLAAAASFGIGTRRMLRGEREARPAEPAIPAPPRAAPAEAVPEALPAPVPGPLPAPVLEPVPEPVLEPEPVPEPPDLRSRLGKTRNALVGRIESLLRGRPELDEETLEEIEAILFGADLGVRTAEELLETARAASSREELVATLESRALEMLGDRPAMPDRSAARPWVILVVGVNGSGKTTTIGKLASRWTAAGRRVLVVAADTFRAAAIDQLEVWAERSGSDFVRGAPGGDPAAVAFDAIKAALAREVDLVLIDTAGRLQTHSGLMDELSKMSRVIQRDIPEAPHEVLLVLDANTGQNGIRQAQEFSRAVAVTGIVLTKLDGTAKGGVVLGIAQETGLPVRYVGLGEKIEDLVDFDPEAFVRALFAA